MYKVLLFLHVLSVVVGVGPTFALPGLMKLRGDAPSPAVLQVEYVISRYASIGLGVILLTGLGLISESPAVFLPGFGEARWLHIAITLFLVYAGLGTGYAAPRMRKAVTAFHFYEPFHLTHYKASWTRLKDFEGQVQYPGQIVVNGQAEEEMKVYNRDTLEKMMAKPIHLADSLDLPLYCGEFGVIDGTPEESKKAWYRDLVAIFDKHDIAYANWNFKAGSFGIVDRDLKPDTAMVKILTGK